MAIAIGIEARIKRAQFERAGHSRAQEGLDFWAPNINIFATDGDAGRKLTARTRWKCAPRRGLCHPSKMQGDDSKTKLDE